MMNRRSLMIAAAAASTAAAPVLAQTASEARRAEVAAIRRFAEQTHPRGRDAAADADWAARWDRAAQAAAASDGVYVLGIQRALAWFGDGHTLAAVHANGGRVPDGLSGGAWPWKLPVALKTFDDGLWVTQTSAAASSALGRRVEAINGRPVNEIIRTHADAWCGSDAWAHEWAGEVMAGLGGLQGLGVVGDRPDAPVRLAFADGEVAVTPLREAADLQVIDRAKSDVERWAEEAGGGNFHRRIGAGETLYVSLDQMGDIGERKFLDVVREVIALLPEPALTRVVIDLRRNGGGNNGFGEPLRKALERSRFNRPGGLYVMISPHTFSAAQNLATRLERETFALFAGGPSGGAPNHYGDARGMNGEASGLPVFVSTLPWFDSAPQDQRRWIMPDLPASRTFDDWRTGRDAALAAVLADTTSGEGNDVSLLRTFPYRRPSQAVAWTPFWRA